MRIVDGSGCTFWIQVKEKDLSKKGVVMTSLKSESASFIIKIFVNQFLLVFDLLLFLKTRVECFFAAIL